MYRKYTVGQKVLILRTGKGKMSPNWNSRIVKAVYQKVTALKLRSDSGVLIFRNLIHVSETIFSNTLSKISNWSPYTFTLVLKVRLGYTKFMLL